MKFKVTVTQSKPLDGRPCFLAEADVASFAYGTRSHGQTEEEALTRLKIKLEEAIDNQGILSMKTFEVEVP